MEIILPENVPEKLKEEYELNVIVFKVLDLLTVIERDKFPILYKISLNGDITEDILRELHPVKGPELTVYILGNEEFKNIFRKKCRDKCRTTLFHSNNDTDKTLLLTLGFFEAKEALKNSN